VTPVSALTGELLAHHPELPVETTGRLRPHPAIVWLRIG
jgi:hypothetical protein